MSIVGKYVMHNGSIIEGVSFSSEKKGMKIYEVIRVMKGKYLFLEDHLARLHNSVRLAGEVVPVDEKTLVGLLYQLIEANKMEQGNVKVVFLYPEDRPDYYAHFIPHSYPSEEQYQQGVAVKSLKAERPNPNAKIWHDSLKQEVEKMLSEKNIYEAVLIDAEGYILEGSRSNIFFIREDKLITAPYEKILPGITRRYVLQCALRHQLDIEERCLHYKELTSVDAVFLSGTSPKILPVALFDSYSFSPDNTFLRGLMKCYDGVIEEYLNRK